MNYTEESNVGMDPAIKKYFRKIMYSFSFGLLWLLFNSTAGLYFRLGFMYEGVQWYNVLFYLLFAGSFFLLLRYYYKTWKD